MTYLTYVCNYYTESSKSHLNPVLLRDSNNLRIQLPQQWTILSRIVSIDDRGKYFFTKILFLKLLLPA